MYYVTIILSVEVVGNYTPDNLNEQYYQKNNLNNSDC